MSYILVMVYLLTGHLLKPSENTKKNNNRKTENLIFKEPTKQPSYQPGFLATDHENQFLQI